MWNFALKVGDFVTESQGAGDISGDFPPQSLSKTRLGSSLCSISGLAHNLHKRLEFAPRHQTCFLREEE